MERCSKPRLSDLGTKTVASACLILVIHDDCKFPNPAHPCSSLSPLHPSPELLCPLPHTPCRSLFHSTHTLQCPVLFTSPAVPCAPHPMPFPFPLLAIPFSACPLPPSPAVPCSPHCSVVPYIFSPPLSYQLPV